MTTTYLFGKLNQTHIMSMQRQAFSMIKSFFSKHNILIGKPQFIVKTDKITVHIFYYSTNNKLDHISINILGNALTQCWGRHVELRLIQLNHVILDSTIFAQYLSINSHKYSFNRLFDILKAHLPPIVAEGSLSLDSPTYKEHSLASHITGIKIKLSGRLTTQRSIPRQTTNIDRLGSSAKGKHGMNHFSQFTSKNKLGSFTIKVWVSEQIL